MNNASFLILCIFVTIVFYVWDISQHRKTLNRAMLKVHWQHKIFVNIHLKQMCSVYPMLSKVTASFSQSKLQDDSIQEIVSRSKLLDIIDKQQLNKEIDDLMENGSENDKDVFIWYLLTCLWIQDYKYHHMKVMNIEKETQKLKDEKSERDRILNRGFCLM
ncbi:hypothetical protein H1220_08045 [Carnobacteriaceae bacterium zg-84]|uniref:hypothetical protein n=1 Tax=Granulicatella sp. zg-84 TaxID=2678503 RepID=UPI0013C23A13|nr:hypothetical protein [Granulicatella sp. zg-84]NEW66287.1 hypothetical protein [Granulicatella sp. zg-84]QMI85626.1 hypothetical protein H1220_08045 [Carnobacteriaceae bacterium zg-84]